LAKNSKVSQETADQALKVAKGTARPGQTKEQTKLIAQGIEKGVAEFKKREKAKARERDKERKKSKKSEVEVPDMPIETGMSKAVLIPWGLLLVSWSVFIAYEFLA